MSNNTHTIQVINNMKNKIKFVLIIILLLIFNDLSFCQDDRDSIRNILIGKVDTIDFNCINSNIILIRKDARFISSYQTNIFYIVNKNGTSTEVPWSLTENAVYSIMKKLSPISKLDTKTKTKCFINEFFRIFDGVIEPDIKLLCKRKKCWKCNVSYKTFGVDRNKKSVFKYNNIKFCLFFNGAIKNVEIVTN